MALPALFGDSWEEFVANWCLGNEPIEDRLTVERALSALFRIWPEREETLAASSYRGLVLISPVIEDGIVLSACENLAGFSNVLRRLKDGERSAHSELTFAGRMVRAGYQPTLEPALGNGVLDVSIPTAEGPVYCEVIAPETCDAIQEVKSLASALATTLRNENKGSRVEVLLGVDIDDDVVAKVAESVRTRPNANETWAIEQVAVASKRLAGEDANVGPTIPSAQVEAIIGAAECLLDSGVRTAGIVRVPVTDTRAKRLLYGESHRFSPGEMNVLVMDVTHVVGGLKAWRPLIERCFQPKRNRRFGAAVLFFSGITGEKMSIVQNWVVIRNPHAYRPVPESLLREILDPACGP